MKLLVCISKTPDTTSKISFVEDGKKFNEEGITFIMNPYDEWYALVRAIELKEKNGGSVTVVSVGDSSSDIVIRKALAIGADDAIRIDTLPTSSEIVAKEIAHVAKSQNYDIIFLGKETIDYNGGEVGAMLAELLDYDYCAFVNDLQIDGGNKIISREIEGGIERVSCSGPIVISAAKGLAEQRIPNMQGIMMSKRKPLEVLPPLSPASHTHVRTHTLPPSKKGVVLVNPDNMSELARLLHEEAKAI
jgi:electron transfer flavoprotein beta subunit